MGQKAGQEGARLAVPGVPAPGGQRLGAGHQGNSDRLTGVSLSKFCSDKYFDNFLVIVFHHLAQNWEFKPCLGGGSL